MEATIFSEKQHWKFALDLSNAALKGYEGMYDHISSNKELFLETSLFNNFQHTNPDRFEFMMRFFDLILLITKQDIEFQRKIIDFILEQDQYADLVEGSRWSFFYLNTPYLNLLVEAAVITITHFRRLFSLEKKDLAQHHISELTGKESILTTQYQHLAQFRETSFSFLKRTSIEKPIELSLISYFVEKIETQVAHLKLRFELKTLGLEISEFPLSLFFTLVKDDGIFPCIIKSYESLKERTTKNKFRFPHKEVLLEMSCLANSGLSFVRPVLKEINRIKKLQDPASFNQKDWNQALVHEASLREWHQHFETIQELAHPGQTMKKPKNL